MQINGWDQSLKVTADGTGLVGHAGAVLLRKAADQAGLTAQLSGAMRRKGHQEVLSAALRQVPARSRRKVLVRVDGAGASHDLVNHLLSLSSSRTTVLFTCGWMITDADEQAIALIPAGAWQPGTAQDGAAEDDKDVAEVTGLMSRAGNWPDGLRWIARRVKPSGRHLRNLTDYEKQTGWKYSITCTNASSAKHENSVLSGERGSDQ
jgi:hypothetical protein